MIEPALTSHSAPIEFGHPDVDPVSVERASEIVLSTVRKAGTEDVPLTEALGRILAETLKADDDLPRYTQCTIDGIAINLAGLDLSVALKITGVQRAGVAAVTLASPGDCIEVMAGAVLPAGADCVVPYAFFTLCEEDGARVAQGLTIPEPLGRYIHQRGDDRQKGDILAGPGREISAAEIAIAASVGKSELRVAKLPRVAVITTGDELVSVTTRPLAWQMRESNSYAIAIILKKAAVDCDRFHLPDDPDVIEASIAEWSMTYDVLLFSGGASKGIGDYVPAVLERIGVEPLFHGVTQRPGKPFWFGVKPNGGHGGDLIVFALPGNPVSSFVCALRYCLPWFEASFGREPRQPEYARLAKPVGFTTLLTHFIPVQLTEQRDGLLIAEPRLTHGSGDPTGLLFADAFMELPAGTSAFDPGETYPVIRYR